jgi:ribonuclease Z
MQLQVQKTNAIKPGKITKIFITHAHGDHSFGLPGLLCLMGQAERGPESPVIDIYGPQGLRMWLRTAIRYSVSRIVPPYRVHEIMNVPMAPAWAYNARTGRSYYRSGVPPNTKWNLTKGVAGEDPTSWISVADNLNLAPSSLYGEVNGGRDIYPVIDHPRSVDGAPVWHVVDETDVQVYAAPMSHPIPCVGYVVEEMPRAGRLKSELVDPIVRRNFAALKQAGFVVPMKAMAVIKNLPSGAAFTFPDGTVLRQEDAVEPKRSGRKIVVCGDTCCARALLKLGEGADVIIHEATNAYLLGVDRKEATLQQVTRDAIIHGHSTPQMAANFCRSVNGRLLLMNHFSSRYKGDCSVDSMSIMMRIEKQACLAGGLSDDQVVAAWDMMVLPVAPH